MRPRTLHRALVLAVFVAACHPADSERHTAADSVAIETLYREWPRTAEAGDVDAYATFLHDSVTLLIPAAPAIRGIPAYKAALVPLVETTRFRVRIAPLTQVHVSGSWAHVLYHAEVTTWPRAGGDTTVTRNRYVDVLRRDSTGAWKVYVHGWQEDGPEGS